MIHVNRRQPSLRPAVAVDREAVQQDMGVHAAAVTDQQTARFGVRG